MILPVNEKNLRILLVGFGSYLTIAIKREPDTLLSIYKDYFTNVRAM